VEISPMVTYHGAMLRATHSVCISCVLQWNSLWKNDITHDAVLQIPPELQRSNHAKSKTIPMKHHRSRSHYALKILKYIFLIPMGKMKKSPNHALEP